MELKDELSILISAITARIANHQIEAIIQALKITSPETVSVYMSKIEEIRAADVGLKPLMDRHNELAALLMKQNVD